MKKMNSTELRGISAGGDSQATWFPIFKALLKTDIGKTVPAFGMTLFGLGKKGIEIASSLLKIGFISLDDEQVAPIAIFNSQSANLFNVIKKGWSFLYEEQT